MIDRALCGAMILVAVLFFAAMRPVLQFLPSHSVTAVSAAALTSAIAPDATFGEAGVAATNVLERTWYDDGAWRVCALATCEARVSDWGADALTGVLYLRWTATHDGTIAARMRRLLARAPQHAMPCDGPACETWSDVPMWDAVAAMREGEAGGEPARGLALAARDFRALDRSRAYTGGACPEISFQRLHGAGGGLKTLETDSNYIKAALLLYDATGRGHYLSRAVARYAVARRTFLDARVPLYTTYVFDNGTTCAQLPHRFFASVNGNMIWNGLELAKITGKDSYRREAADTGRAVNTSLADPSRAFVDMQAGNDVVEPLVEAMLRLATDEREAFARQWIVRNAGDARSGVRDDGNYGRFVNGPPTASTATAWESNGGLALQIAAAALAPLERPAVSSGWKGARYVAADVRTLPSSMRFTGSAIALVGTVGEHCCEAGHARVFVDGVETFDRTGIWQNKSSAGLELPGSILFAWRWPHAGPHTLLFVAGEPNAKEGGAFLHIAGYFVE